MSLSGSDRTPSILKLPGQSPGPAKAASIEQLTAASPSSAGLTRLPSIIPDPQLARNKSLVNVINVAAPASPVAGSMPPAIGGGGAASIAGSRLTANSIIAPTATVSFANTNNQQPSLHNPNPAARVAPDISYRAERPGHGFLPTRDEFLDFVVPNSVIPEKDHLRADTLLPLPSQPRLMQKFNVQNNMFSVQVFPSPRPAGRMDVVLLERWVQENIMRPPEKLETEADALAMQSYLKKKKKKKKTLR
eukprot:gnl/Hemi2/19343_TR6427_c0_g3_i1.p1 gnl/Hemi2/19343_TR6427_c0_g3~~gnl/Hemi2/19343_TR6427_c0_g3_i1.p1  ORF type:complete len:248 (-),score=56.50 gnl/Hemi2/19343_TR6427_c0_g3_i1:5-748(-)